MDDVFDALALTRWVHFTSVFALFGSAMFWSYVNGEYPRARHATNALLRFAAPAAAISGLGWLAGIIANMTGGFSHVAEAETLRLFFFETQFGAVALLRLALLVAAVLTATAPLRNRAGFPKQLTIGALLLINQAWLGHAAEGGAGLSGVSMILFYSLHVLAASVWVGGLPPLLFALVELRPFDARERRERTLALLSQYSPVAMIAVAILAISGVVNVGFRADGSVEKFCQSEYGAVLAVKAVLVIAMLALAFLNRFIIMTKISATSPDGATTQARLRFSVTCELVLGVLVLGAAAVLGVTPPPQ